MTVKKEETPCSLLVPGMLVTTRSGVVIVLAAADDRAYLLGDRWVRWRGAQTQR